MRQWMQHWLERVRLWRAYRYWAVLHPFYWRRHQALRRIVALILDHARADSVQYRACRNETINYYMALIGDKS